MGILKSLAWLGFLASLAMNIESHIGTVSLGFWGWFIQFFLMLLIYTACLNKGRSKLYWSDCRGLAKKLLYLALPYLAFTFFHEMFLAKPEQGDTVMRLASAFWIYCFLFTAGALSADP